MKRIFVAVIMLFDVFENFPPMRFTVLPVFKNIKNSQFISKYCKFPILKNF